MNIGWHENRVKESLRKRKNQTKCARCRLLYDKTNDYCPHCTGIEDEELRRVLAIRLEKRIRLGKVMFLAAFVILVVMFFSYI